MVPKGVRVVACGLTAIWASGLLSGSASFAGERSGTRGLAVSLEEPSAVEDPVLDEAATLADYLAYAALHNPGLEAAFNRWRAALEKVPQVRSMPDPKFNYAYFIREVETRVGPQRQKFGISQTFPWFGKLRLRGDVALGVADAERERYELAKLRLFYRVKGAYYEYGYVARAIAVTEESVQLLGQLESVVGARYEAGEATFADVIKSQVELSRLEDRLRALEDLRGPMSARLNSAMGRRAKDILPWPREIPEVEISASDEEIQAWAVDGNPELRVLDSAAAKERAAEALAGKDRFPDLTLGVEVIDTDEALNPGMIDRGKDPVVAVLSVNLPLWYSKYRAARREAQARYRAAIAERTETENRLTADLQLALYHFRDAERRIQLYGDALIPRTRQSLEVSRRAFTVGAAGFLDLVDAQRTLLEFELSYERARADRAQRLAELEMLIGREIPLVGGEDRTRTEGAR